MNNNNNQLESFEKLALLGITLSVKTINGDLFTGELFYYNQDSKVLILKEKIHESNKYNYRYLNTACLTEFKLLELRDINQVDFDLQDIDFEEILKRESGAGNNKGQENKGNYGEYLFQKLSSQYDVVWEGKDIMIKSIKLKLRSPFRQEDVFCADTKTVNEFMKQLEDLKKKFK